MTDLGGLVKAVTEWPARYFFALAFVAAALLLLSHSPLAEVTGIAAAPTWFRLSLTVVTLAFLAVGLTKGLSYIATRRAASRTARARGQAYEEELRNLTPDECAVLARFVDGNVRVLPFLANTSGQTSVAVAQTLARRGHLSPVSRHDTMFFIQIEYAIQEPTFSFLRQHPELLQGGRTVTD